MTIIWILVGLVVLGAFSYALKRARMRGAAAAKKNPATRRWHEQIFVSSRVRYLEREYAAQGRLWQPVGTDLARPVWYSSPPDHGHRP